MDPPAFVARLLAAGQFCSRGSAVAPASNSHSKHLLTSREGNSAEGRLVLVLCEASEGVLFGSRMGWPKADYSMDIT